MTTSSSIQLTSGWKLLYHIGVGFTFFGSFLPWVQGGDLITYRERGFQIYPSIADNGGLAVIILSLALIILVYRPPNFIEKPRLWFLVCAITLMFASVCYVADVTVLHLMLRHVTGTPAIDYGLTMVSFGSSLLGIVGALNYRS